VNEPRKIMQKQQRIIQYIGIIISCFAILLFVGCSQKIPAPIPVVCDDSTPECLCAHYANESTCITNPECRWFGFHNNFASCTLKFCMDYPNVTECHKHSRCIWVRNKLSNEPYCEDSRFSTQKDMF